MQENKQLPSHNEKIYEIRQSLSTQYFVFCETEHITPNDYKHKLELCIGQEEKFKICGGTKAGDLAYLGIHKCFSDLFIDLMHANGITNFSKYPFMIQNKKDIPQYYWLDIACKKIKKYKVKKKGYMSLGSIYFDIKDWGSEDLFTLEDTLVILCTEKVKKIVERNKLKNFRFVIVNRC
jgi:hypothetical protein